jgi:hypothetical protein
MAATGFAANPLESPAGRGGTIVSLAGLPPPGQLPVVYEAETARLTLGNGRQQRSVYQERMADPISNSPDFNQEDRSSLRPEARKRRAAGPRISPSSYSPFRNLTC